MKFYTLLILSLALTQFTFAQETAPANECEINAQYADEVIPSDEVNGDYWTNMLDENTVMFTNTGGTSGRFQAYDLKNKVPIRLTQRIDPFPAPDGRKMYIHPSPIRFYEFDTVREKIEKKGISPYSLENLSYGGTPVNDGTIQQRTVATDGPSAAETDPGMRGYYQSMAGLKKVQSATENYSDYRILTGQSEGSIKDYRVTYGPGDKIISVKPLSTPVRLCPNMRGGSYDTNLDFDTPIISPKGDEFAVMDRRTQSTVIIKFDPATGSCERVFDFGFATGKVHFSKDGKQIAFHANNLSDQGTPLANSNLARPYVYDRETKQLTSLTLGAMSDNAQGTFPAFRGNGKMIYQRASYNRETGKTSRAWVTVDPKKLNSITFNGSKTCPTGTIDPQIQALSALWKSICQSTSPNKNFLDWNISVDPATCKSFIEKNYATYAQETTAAQGTPVTKEVMQRACPTKTLPKTGLALVTPGAPQTFPPVLQNRCVICHVQGSPHGYIPWDNPEEMRKMKAIGESAKPGQPFAGKTFLEQLTKIVHKNLNTNDPGAGIPRVPADGNRLNETDEKQIIDWVKDGKFGQYNPVGGGPAGNNAAGTGAY